MILSTGTLNGFVIKTLHISLIFKIFYYHLCVHCCLPLQCLLFQSYFKSVVNFRALQGKMPTASVDNTLRNLHDTKAEFNDYFIKYSFKIIPCLRTS